MPDRPAAPELIEAVFEFLSGELLPTLDDHRLKFRTLVAMNALAIARRELPADTIEATVGSMSVPMSSLCCAMNSPTAAVRSATNAPP